MKINLIGVDNDVIPLMTTLGSDGDYCIIHKRKLNIVVIIDNMDYFISLDQQI